MKNRPFWTTKAQAMIDGLKTATETAAAKGVRDSLWQAPDAAKTALNQATEAVKF